MPPCRNTDDYKQAVTDRGESPRANAKLPALKKLLRDLCPGMLTFLKTLCRQDKLTPTVAYIAMELKASCLEKDLRDMELPALIEQARYGGINLSSFSILQRQSYCFPLDLGECMMRARTSPKRT